jgi:capsular polysaccharide export protein
LGVANRIHYIHDETLSDLFRYCSGVVTINSTVGLAAVKYHIPTKVMGTTFYNLPGLTAQVPLDDFWKDRPKVDEKLFVKFHNFLVEQTQINGHFSAYFPFEKTFKIEQVTASASPKSHPSPVSSGAGRPSANP